MALISPHQIVNFEKSIIVSQKETNQTDSAQYVGQIRYNHKKNRFEGYHSNADIYGYKWRGFALELATTEL
jgi:hypothetical protein